MRGYIWMKQSIHYQFRSTCVILTLMDVLSSLRPWHYVCSTFAFCLSKVIQNLTLASVWSRKHVWNCWTRWRKSKQMQPMWLCIRSLVLKTFKKLSSERVPSECSKSRYIGELYLLTPKIPSEWVPSECSQCRYIGDKYLHQKSPHKAFHSHVWQQCRIWLMITSWILFWGSSWMARREKRWN